MDWNSRRWSKERAMRFIPDVVYEELLVSPEAAEEVIADEARARPSCDQRFRHFGKGPYADEAAAADAAARAARIPAIIELVRNGTMDGGRATKPTDLTRCNPHGQSTTKTPSSRR